MMNEEKYLKKAKEEMVKVNYLDFNDEELMEIYYEYYQKVEPFLDIVGDFKLPSKGATVREIRSVLRVTERHFRLMRKVFEELDEALDTDKSFMKMKAQLDLQRAIIASEYKNAKMIEMQLKRYDDEYSNKDNEVNVEMPKTLSVQIVDASVDEIRLEENEE